MSRGGNICTGTPTVHMCACSSAEVCMHATQMGSNGIHMYKNGSQRVSVCSKSGGIKLISMPERSITIICSQVYSSARK